jgi:lipopolysaccharide biosynthesis regulator YciM
MFWFAIFISVMLVTLLGLQIYWVLAMRKAQKQYLDQARHEEPTMWDVREVLLDGDKDLAVQLYCDIFRIQDIERARKEVEEFSRHINK